MIGVALKKLTDSEKLAVSLSFLEIFKINLEHASEPEEANLAAASAEACITLMEMIGVIGLDQSKEVKKEFKELTSESLLRMAKED